MVTASWDSGDVLPLLLDGDFTLSFVTRRRWPASRSTGRSIPAVDENPGKILEDSGDP